MTFNFKRVHTPNKLLYTLGYKFHYQKLVKKTLGAKINNDCIKNVQPPFIIIANHASKLDYGIVAAAVYPYKCNFVGSVNSFVGNAWLVRALGTLAKRQFTVDLRLVRDIKYLVSKNATIALFPEARMSADGRCSAIPSGIAKLVKMSSATLLCLNMKGVYLSRPKWLGLTRKVPVYADLSVVAKKEELPDMPLTELQKRIQDAMRYDDYAYQREKKISILDNRCTSLHTLLYRCPVCGKEFCMQSTDTALHCDNCGAHFNMDEYGVLSNGKNDCTVTEWYDMQKDAVAQEVKSGKYVFEDDCQVEAIFDKPKYVKLGKGRITHNFDGFTLSVGDVCEEFPSKHNFAIAFDTGSCIYLSTSTASYKIIPANKAIQCTKVSLAVEAIYEMQSAK